LLLFQVGLGRKEGRVLTQPFKRLEGGELALVGWKAPWSENFEDPRLKGLFGTGTSLGDGLSSNQVSGAVTFKSRTPTLIRLTTTLEAVE